MVFRVKTKEGFRSASSMYLIERKMPVEEQDQMKVQRTEESMQEQPQQFKEPTPLVQEVPKKDTRIEVKEFF